MGMGVAGFFRVEKMVKLDRLDYHEMRAGVPKGERWRK
jgi:hypothetical protein